MEALSEDEEPQTPIEEFLKPLGLVQHRQTMRQLGFDNPATDFKAQTPDDAQEMKTALLDEKVPLGHVAKSMRSASAFGCGPQLPRHRRWTRAWSQCFGLSRTLSLSRLTACFSEWSQHGHTRPCR